MYQLARTFKAQLRLALHACQTQLRVLRANRLLASGCPIVGAADHCSFHD
jgi:hypothetical protein